MEIMNLSKKRFESLEKYELPSSVYNTEAKMYILPIKNKWSSEMKLLKRLYITSGPVFGNKLKTINSLIDLHEEINMPEIIFPEKIAVVNQQLVGYTMQLVNSINLGEALNSADVSPQQKIKYLRQIGEILEHMDRVRTYTTVNDFYLNDLHENNFIIDLATDDIKVVDIDSCKIAGNYTFGSKYLTNKSLISTIKKYPQEENTICGGYFRPTYDTEMYCYIMIILNTLYGGGINKISLPEFYNYLEYLSTIGVDRELLTIFERILTNSPNTNPYESLESIAKVFGRANQHVYNRVRKR